MIPPEYRDKPIIGAQVPWKEIEGQLLRVQRFIPFIADTRNDMRRHASAWGWAWIELLNREQSGPYTPVIRRVQFRKRLHALLEVECPGKLAEPSYMPVCHRFDFVKLWTIFAVEGNLDPDEEVLVGYPCYCDTSFGSVLRAFMPQLDVMVHPKGFLEMALNRHELAHKIASEHSKWFRTPRFLREK
jgi:hypothetical protein